MPRHTSPSRAVTASIRMDLDVVAPPRCNFAGFCNYCGLSNCRSTTCIEVHLNTWWAACEICYGIGADDANTTCHCLYGVAQVWPGCPGAVQPR